MKGIPVLILLLGLVAAASLPDPVLQRFYRPLSRTIQTAVSDSRPSARTAGVSVESASPPTHSSHVTPTPEAILSTIQTAGDTTYTVSPGDTLGALATAFGVTVDALVKANGIVDPNLIRVGRVLVVPPPG